MNLPAILYRGFLATGIAATLAASAAAVSAQEAATPPPEASAEKPADEAVTESAGEAIDISSFAAVDEPPTFDDPGQAIDAFKAALVANDLAALAKLLGLDVDKLKADENTMSAFAAIRDAAAFQVVVQDLEDRKLLSLGAKLWPFPFPLVQGEDKKWAFDTFDGLEEIINRHVGENEVQAIKTMREYVDAQREYASAGPRRRRRAGVCPEADQQRRRNRRHLLAGRPGRRRKPGRRLCHRSGGD